MSLSTLALHPRRSQSTLGRVRRGAAFALPFGGEPEQLAANLLTQTDPAPTLQSWLDHVPAPKLARVLHALVAALRGGAVSPALRDVSLDLRSGECSVRLDLLLLPSIFVPEEWSMTFLEGLLRKPPSQYAGKRVIELGTGSGWIALALLCFTRIEHLLGLDLNPDAVLMARLNAILNGYDARGAELPGCLARRFDARVSDLLSHPRQMGITADLVVGCIPQVIAPSLDLDSIQGRSDLSNYTVAQGLVEDQFGLGLNGRALREALSVLSPGGSVILNLAGRPGPATLSWMFRRRGFESEVMWSARVEQAGDTDIAPLALLEQESDRPFSFYLHRSSTESVPARLALAALRAGRKVYHDLLVIEGKPRSEALSPLAAALGRLDLEGLWEEIDLSAASDAQLRFVTRLAESFRRDPRAPYPHEAGNPDSRARITRFLEKFHGLSLSTGDVFLAPSRRRVVQGLAMSLLAPGDKVVVSESLKRMHGPVLARAGADVVWAHDDAAELAELLPLLSPRLVLLGATPELKANRHALHALLRSCERSDALLCIDGAESFEISSGAQKGALLGLLAEANGSPHLALLFGLVHHEAPSDLHLGLFLSRHARLMRGLAATAEVTYSRLSCFHQAYYDMLFDELMSFRVQSSRAEPAPLPADAPGPPLSTAMCALLEAPAFARPSPAPDVIRLDYGENELPLPARLCAGILQGFLLPRDGEGRSTSALAARRAACEYLQKTRLPTITPFQVLLGPGTLPLLFEALSALKKRLGRAPRALLPRGTYCVIPPLLSAAGCVPVFLSCSAPDFLATTEALDEAGDFDVLLLTHPANPSGAAYEPETMRRLIKRSAERGARVIIDEVFGLLSNLDGPIPLRQHRLSGLSQAEAERVLVLAGASKELAAGGLRLGMAATVDTGWLRDIEALQDGPLPRDVLLAAERVLSRFADQRTEIGAMRRDLRRRRDRLAAGLERLGFGVDARERGGLSLLVDVSPLCDGDPERFVLDLEARAGVRMTTPSCLGLTHHARACFAIPEERIDKALSRLAALLERHETRVVAHQNAV